MDCCPLHFLLAGREARLAGCGGKDAEALHQAALAFPLDLGDLRARPMVPEDVAVCAAICREAFNIFNASVGIDPEFPPAEVVDVPTITLSQAFQGGFKAFVVEDKEGRIVGSNMVELRDGVAGIGPISVASGGQNAGAGKLLMRAVMRAAAEEGVRSVRLHQVGNNTKSFSLYLSLGFDPKVTCGEYQGLCTAAAPAGFKAQPLDEALVERCSALHAKVCGTPRARDIAAALRGPFPTCAVLDSGGRLVAYCTGCHLGGHTVATSLEAFQSLIVFVSNAVQAARQQGTAVPPPTVHAPHTYPGLLRWLVQSGFRLKRQIVQMSYGPHPRPRGIYCPAIQY